MPNYAQRQDSRKRALSPRQKWRPHPLYPRYEIPNRPTPDRAARRKLLDGSFRYLRSVQPKADPYSWVSLCVNGQRKPFRVQYLVADAWLPPKPFPGAMLLHRDDNKHNNSKQNLYWGSRADNHDDAVRNGKIKGLGRETAEFIRTHFDRTPERVKAAAAAFGVTRKSIDTLLRGLSYREIARNA